MKYCSSCKSLINEEAEVCSCCGGALSKTLPESVVTVAVVKGTAVSILESALKAEGIPCSFEKTDSDIYNAYNAKVSADSDNKVLVPFEMYHKAFDVCEGFGFVKEEDRLLPEEEEVDTDNRSYDEKFEAGTGMKHRTWSMLGIIIFVVLACVVVWGVDMVAEFFKKLF